MSETMIRALLAKDKRVKEPEEEVERLRGKPGRMSDDQLIDALLDGTQDRRVLAQAAERIALLGAGKEAEK